MIPNTTVRALLSTLLDDLVTPDGEPDFQRYRALETLQKRCSAFYDLLSNAQEDMSVVLAMYEKDPDCYDENPAHRLQALVDYVHICCAIYNLPTKQIARRNIH